MTHLGIDLGTTYSLVAHVNSQGIPTLFPDRFDANHFRTPSVVHIGEEGAFVGAVAEEVQLDEPALPLWRHIKLSMGDDVSLDDYQGRAWRPEAISALILKKMMADVELHTPEDIESVVIAVPANFNDKQRRATKLAALLAGLPSPLLIEEPIAAATFFGAAEGKSDATLFIYDLGGGTFDATILQTAADGLYALATEGRNDVGGKSVNEVLIRFIAREFNARFGVDPTTDPLAVTRLGRFAEDAKIKLSMPGKGQVRETLVMAGHALDFIITRSQFEDMISPLIDRTLEVSISCLKAAGLRWSDMDKVLLAGGSSLIPLVRQRLKSVARVSSGQLETKQPHQAVAFGAAMIAAQRASKDGEGTGVHRQVTSNALGLKVWDKKLNKPVMETLIDRNSVLPAVFKRTFYTQRADQERLVLELMQQNSETNEAEILGKYSFGPIKHPRKNLPVEIQLTCDLEGLLHVQAKQPDSGEVLKFSLGGEEGASPVDWIDAQQALVDSVRVNE